MQKQRQTTSEKLLGTFIASRKELLQENRALKAKMEKVKRLLSDGDVSGALRCLQNEGAKLNRFTITPLNEGLQ